MTVCAGLIVPEVWALKVKPVGNTAADVTAKADVAAIRAALRTNICTTRLLALVSIRRFIILTSEHDHKIAARTSHRKMRTTAAPVYNWRYCPSDANVLEPRAQPEL